MIVLTYHAKLRYVQRVLGLFQKEEEEILAKNYIEDNDKEITYSLWKELADSKVLYESYEARELKSIKRNILRLSGDILLILNSSGQKLVTLLTIDKSGSNLVGKLSKDSRILDNELSKERRVIRLAKEEIQNIEGFFNRYGEPLTANAKRDIKALEKRIAEGEKVIEPLQKEKNNLMQVMRRRLRLENIHV